MTTPDRDQRIDGFQSGLHRLVDGFSRDDSRGFHIDPPPLHGARNGAFAVERLPQRIDNTREQHFSYRKIHDGAGAFDRVAFLDRPVFAEDHHADIVALEVQGHALDAAREFDHLAGLDIVEPINARNAVSDRQHLANLADLRLRRQNRESRASEWRRFPTLEYPYS